MTFQLLRGRSKPVASASSRHLSLFHQNRNLFICQLQVPLVRSPFVVPVYGHPASTQRQTFPPIVRPQTATLPPIVGKLFASVRSFSSFSEQSVHLQNPRCVGEAEVLGSRCLLLFEAQAKKEGVARSGVAGSIFDDEKRIPVARVAEGLEAEYFMKIGKSFL